MAYPDDVLRPNAGGVVPPPPREPVAPPVEPMAAPQAGPGPEGPENLGLIDDLINRVVSQVPSLAPDADLLMDRLTTVAGIPAPPGSSPQMSSAGPAGLGNATMGPGYKEESAGGAVASAAKLEVELRKFGAAHPEADKEIRFFVAKMMDEVPRALAGERAPRKIPLAQPVRNEPGARVPTVV